MKKTVLINILLALMYSGRTAYREFGLVDRIRLALELLAIPELSGGGSDESNINARLRDLIVLFINKHTADEAIDLTELTMELENIGIYHPEVVNTFVGKVNRLKEMPQEEIDKQAAYAIKKMNDYIRVTQLGAQMTKASFALRDAQMLGDIAQAVKAVEEYQTHAQEFLKVANATSKHQVTSISGITSVSSTAEPDSVGRELDDFKKTYSGIGGLKLGLQGWNEAFGPDGEIPRGVMIEIQALSGCGKGETMRRLLMDICRYNDPVLFDEKLKPMVMYFTAEDTPGEAWGKMYHQLYCETNNAFPPTTTTPKEQQDYVMEKLRARGFEFTLVKCVKDTTPIEQVLQVMDHYRNAGWEIVAAGVDYMAKFDHSHYRLSVDSYNIQRKHSVLGGYCKDNKITVFAANQLGNERAIELASVEDDFAREAERIGFNVGSNRILDELDARLVVHVKQGPNGSYYHQFCTGKLRWAKGWPRDKRYSTYQMHAIDGQAGGFILPDIGETSRACRDMGGGLKAGGNEAAYF